VEGTIPARTLGLTINRSIDGGMHEDLDVVNHGRKSVKFQLEISVRCDFGDIFEVKAGHILRRGRITTEWMLGLQIDRQGVSSGGRPPRVQTSSSVWSSRRMILPVLVFGRSATN
jgi:hypothetical protein